MVLGHVEIFLTRNDFHLEISVGRIDDVKFIDDCGDSLAAGFGEDDGADVVFVGDMRGTEVHVRYVTYYSVACRDFADVRG